MCDIETRMRLKSVAQAKGHRTGSQGMFEMGVVAAMGMGSGPPWAVQTASRQ